MKINKHQRKPKMQSKMYNPETLASFGTQDTKRKQTKQKTQYNICWTPLYLNRHKKHNKT